MVTGYFDPLLADHARRLEQLRSAGETLGVVIADPPDPLLPAAARAELVAALRAVDWVVIGGSDPEAVLSMLAPDEVIREETADETRRQELIRHVHRRHEIG